jgi:hypothetical protein
MLRTTVIQKAIELMTADQGGDMSTLSQAQIDELAKLSVPQLASLQRIIDHLGAVKTVAGKDVSISGVLRGAAEGDVAGANNLPLPSAWSGEYAVHQKDSWV